MQDSDTANSNGSPRSTPPSNFGFLPWQQLRGKRISYLTLPLLFMATVTEFVILATGWKYQQVVCVPQGMGVTFLGIGPIGATILAVELLKLPLAIWTASRMGWQKWFMILVGLPLVCVLTFQLVKDMAVYEMGVAMTPASQFLEKGAIEDTRIAQLNGELAAIEGKKTGRERKLAELAAQEAKAKADLEESLKRNNEVRQDAVNLTDYQKKELSDVTARQTAIVQQFNADADQINKFLADLRARREIEVGRATKWNAEEARIENAYKARMSDYTNKKTAYDKAKAEYDSANFLKRQLLKEPVSPGVPPEREANTILRPTAIAEFDAQIKAKEAELLAVSNKRRENLALVDADARRLRDEYDRRSTTKRDEADRNRSELSAAQAALAKELKAERQQADVELSPAIQKIDGIRAEIDAARKRAEGYYEEREASIRKTQVHRIATTVEIVRGLIMGERPMSIKATAKERGDILTDQISMVRIWVYPVLAFIVAFLPTLMVEIGFSTVFHPEQTRPAYRLGFLGRRLHWLYTRAGKQKILRAERLAREASARVTAREGELVTANAAVFGHEEKLRKKEDEWEAKLVGLTDSLRQSMLEKDALRDFQKVEIEHEVELRLNAWSERLAQMGKELEDQRAAHEAERIATAAAQQKKLQELAEEGRTQLNQARRELTEAKLAAEENTNRLAQQLKEALQERDTADAQLRLQTDTHALQIKQSREESTRELDKTTRLEKQRSERQQSELTKALQQRTSELEHQFKVREQEMALEFEKRLSVEQGRIEQDAVRREKEFERRLEARGQEVDARWHHELQVREDAAQLRLKQREQQLQAQSEVRANELRKQAAQEFSRRESELERQIETQARESSGRLKQDMQQRELNFQNRLKQQEQELTARAGAREGELQKKWTEDLRAREEAWERQAVARERAIETRLGIAAQQQEEVFQSRLRQRDQQLQVKLDDLRTELKAQSDEAVRRRGAEADGAFRELEAQLRVEMHRKEEAAQAKTKQREQELAAQFAAQAEAGRLAAQARWQMEAETKLRAAIEPIKAQLARAEKERDEAKHATSEAAHQVQDLEKKLTEVSSFFSSWKNGKSVAGVPGSVPGVPS